MKYFSFFFHYLLTRFHSFLCSSQSFVLSLYLLISPFCIFRSIHSPNNPHRMFLTILLIFCTSKNYNFIRNFYYIRMDEAKLKEEIDSAIRCFPDFPTKGVLFRDILPLFSSPPLVRGLCRHIADRYCGQVDAVAALEARGFLFGPIVALELGLPFVPIRKKGKLPGPVHSATYLKEYGEDTFEIHQGALSAGQRILLLDDLLATGGTLYAAVQVIRATKADVRAIFVIVELDGLGGRSKMGDEEAKMTESLLKYS